MVVRGLLITVSILAFLGCDWRTPKAPLGAGGIEAHERVDERVSDLQAQYLFTQSLNSLSSSEHFVLEAMFLDKEGELELHSHFNGYAWRDGVIVRFIKKDDTLILEVSTPGVSPQQSELPAGFLSPDGRMKVRVEVHNGTASGVRVLVWKYNASWQGDLEHPRSFINEGNADFDSQTKQWIFPGHGRGVKWGIEFDRVRLLKAYREAPYVP